MEKPLGSGDVCVVVNGLAGSKSPNVGKIVTIDKRIFGDYGMDHTRFGPMYSCIGHELTIYDEMGAYTLTNKADFPGIWLKRIDPPKVIKELEKVIENC